nr:hypothetical protein [Halothiobacillus sp.]
YYAGDVAAPIFQHIMSGALRMLNIRPDDLPNEPAQMTAQAISPAISQVSSSSAPIRKGGG